MLIEVELRTVAEREGHRADARANTHPACEYIANLQRARSRIERFYGATHHDDARGFWVHWGYRLRNNGWREDQRAKGNRE
jgi:hypothetical protein